MDANPESRPATIADGDAELSQEPLNANEVVDDIAPQELIGGPAGPSVHEELDRHHGMPFKIGEKGGVYLNQVRLAAGFAVDRPIKFDRKRRYMEYAAITGLWKGIADAQVKWRIAAYLREFARQERLEQIEQKINNRLLDDLLALVEGATTTDFEANAHEGVIHFANTMLDTNGDEFKVLPFHSKYRSTRRIPYNYDPEATCPKYLDWLNASMEPDDQRLWQAWCGMLLSGSNTEQKIMLVTGIGASGKGQHVAVPRGIVGNDNVFEFKTKNLGLRFEMNKLIDKMLLIGSDVAPNFLTESAAHYLKSLTGDDAISAEFKNVNGAVNFLGNFNIVITANTKLRIRLEQDFEAWSRRLLVIPFEKQIPANQRVPHFARGILQSEGSGVINFMLAGLRSIRAERIVLTDVQMARVEELLGESDSMRRFMEDEVQLSPDGDLTTDELVRGHERYCQNRGWIAPSRAVVEKEMHKLMQEMYNMTARNDVLRGSTARRGFGGFVLKAEPYKPDQF